MKGLRFEISSNLKLMLHLHFGFSTENCLFINNYTNNKQTSISLIALHFHQYLTIIKHHLPLKKIFKSLVSKQDPIEKREKIAIRTWNNIQKEMKSVMLNTFSLVELKSLLIEFY